MKAKIINIIYSILIILVTVYMFVFSKNTTNIFIDSFSFIINTIIPSLFPFMIFISFILNSNAIDYLSILLKPIGKLFNISGYGSICVIASILGGFPYSSIIVSIFYKEQKIDINEANRLALTLFFPSLSFLFMGLYPIDNNFIYIIITLYISSFIMLFISKYEYPLINKSNNNIKISNDFIKTYFKVMKSSIESIFSISFSIIFFRLISSIFKVINLNELTLFFVSGILEFSYSSINILLLTNKTFLTYLLLNIIISFSSFSIIFQSYYYLIDIKMKMKKLLIYKLATLIISTIIFTTIFLIFK